MNSYATQPLGFWQLVRNCFAGYITIYKKSRLIILFAAIVSFLAGAASGLSENIVIFITLVLFLVAALLNAMILHQGDNVLSSKPVQMSESFSVASKRYLPFLVCYFVVSFLLFLMIVSMLMALITGGPEFGDFSSYFNTQIVALPQWWAIIFIIFAIIFLIVTVFLYVAPAIVILQKNIGAFASFKQSADLVKGHWWRVFGVLAIIHLIMMILFAIVGLIFPAGKAHMLALRNFVFQIIMYPLPVAAALTLLKDLQLRARK